MASHLFHLSKKYYNLPNKTKIHKIQLSKLQGNFVTTTQSRNKILPAVCICPILIYPLPTKLNSYNFYNYYILMVLLFKSAFLDTMVCTFKKV